MAGTTNHDTLMNDDVRFGDATSASAVKPPTEQAVHDCLEKDHYLGSDADSGEHEQVTLRERATPTRDDNKGHLYAKDVDGVSELHYADDTAGTAKETQITSDGEVAGQAGVAALMLGYCRRSMFTFVSDADIKIGPGVYDMRGGVSDRVCYWNAELDYTFTDLATSTWTYLYINDSEDTAATELTAANFTDSQTAPAWSATKHGWYNGDDRCIFAVRASSGSAIYGFQHDGGDQCFFSYLPTASADADTDGAEQNPTAIVPTFCRLGAFTLRLLSKSNSTIDASVSFKLSSGGDYHYMASSVQAVIAYDTNAFSFPLNSSRKFWWQCNQSNYNVTIYQRGWHFPSGI